MARWANLTVTVMDHDTGLLSGDDFLGMARIELQAGREGKPPRRQVLNKEHACPGSCTKSVGGEGVWRWEVEV